MYSSQHSPFSARRLDLRATNSGSKDVSRAGARGARLCCWHSDRCGARLFADNGNTLSAGLKAGAVGLNYYRKWFVLKTAADKFVNTPNIVSIDANAAADLDGEPLVIRALL
jgi:hypothetical protein